MTFGLLVNIHRLSNIENRVLAAARVVKAGMVLHLHSGRELQSSGWLNPASFLLRAWPLFFLPAASDELGAIAKVGTTAPVLSRLPMT